MRRGRLPELKPAFDRWFSKGAPGVYDDEALGDILEANRAEWRIPAYIDKRRFIEFLIENTSLTQIEVLSVGSRRESTIVRYGWGAVDPFLLGVTLRKRSYATHSTAMFLHGLTDQLPQTLFITTQQRWKRDSNLLDQDAITRAFSKKQRESNIAYKALGCRYVILEGTFCDSVEITSIRIPQSNALVLVSGLERTLVDICVRPSYSGGVFQILEAYKRARGQVDMQKLLSIVAAHSYAYPYQQAIGFYLEKAKYSRDAIALFRRLISSYDFYLAYGLIETSYVPTWKLYVPRGFE
jgi:hypothetical protein